MIEAFEKVCEDAIKAEDWFVSLVEDVPFYGGPEEGGWWGSDTLLIAYKRYPSEELAEQAATKARELANELSQESQRSFGQQCLNEMEWLEARGLDADYLPEPDGPSEYRVVVSQGLPVERRGERHYS
jgi:hypothetical protein